MRSFIFIGHRGKGRTTFLLVMLDILKNAPIVSLENIVKRHHALGSINLFNTNKWKHGTYTNQKLERRKKFVEDFYAFIVQRKQGGMGRWIDWKNSKLSTMEP